MNSTSMFCLNWALGCMVIGHRTLNIAVRPAEILGYLYTKVPIEEVVYRQTISIICMIFRCDLALAYAIIRYKRLFNLD